MVSPLLGIVLAGLVGEDCNGNGREDALDVLPGPIRFSDPLPPMLRLPSPQDDVVIVDLDGDTLPDMVFADTQGITVAIADGSMELVPGQELPVGSEPRAIIGADVDGDGDPDVVTANGIVADQPGNVSVFRNDGGRLDLPRNYTGSRFPASIAAGDLDGDADVDLVTVGATLDGVSEGLAVLRNDGTGRFDLDDRYPAGNQPPSGDPSLADLDGDGALDVVIAKPNRRDSVQLFFGDGTGRLGRTLGLELNPGLAPAEVFPVDTDRDGDLDLVSAAWVSGGEGSGAVSILRNEAGGVFASAERAADVPGSRDAVAVDLDADGWVDLALAHAFTPGVSLLLGQAGGFAPPRPYVLPGMAEAIHFADWDRDGHADILALNLLAGSAFLLEGEALAGPASSPARLPVVKPFGPLFADLDGDGDMDLALSTEEPDTLQVFRNESGTLEPLEPMASGEIDSMVPADLDGDGRMDIAVTSVRGLEVFFGSGDLTMDPLFLPSAEGLGTPFVGDMDGDLDLDVFASSWSDEGFFAFFRNGGGRSFAPPIYIAPRVGGDLNVQPVPGDFDGDGDTDVLTGRAGVTAAGAPTAMELALLVNPGNGILELRKIANLDRQPLVIAAGDLDGDGMTDAVLGASGCDACPAESSAMILVFHGTHGLHEVERLPVQGFPARLELRDMDGDRDQDVVLFSYGAGKSFDILRNDGSGRFSLETVPGIRTAAGSFIAEDLDGDGDVDVATAGRGPTPASCRCAVFQVDVFRNQGGATFEEPKSFVTLSSSWVATTAPLRPGPPDLLLIDEEGVTILRNVTEPPASRDQDRDGIPDECQAPNIFHRGDPSGDGTADITDAMVILLHLFLGGPEPGCLDAADANDDGGLDITDPIAILEWLFLGGPRPPPPGPPGEPCGPDPAGSALGCEAFPGCGA